MARQWVIDNFIYIQLISDSYLYFHFFNIVTHALYRVLSSKQNFTVTCFCDLVALWMRSLGIGCHREQGEFPNLITLRENWAEQIG